MKFNSKNFSIQDVIQKRVNQEAEQEHAVMNTNIDLPLYEKPKVVPFSAGVYNLIKNLIP